MKQHLLLLVLLASSGCVTRESADVQSGIFMSVDEDQHLELTIMEDGEFSESVLRNPYTATMGKNRDTLIFSEKIISSGKWEQKGDYLYLFPEDDDSRKLRVEVSGGKVQLKGKKNSYSPAKVNWAVPVAGGRSSHM